MVDHFEETIYCIPKNVAHLTSVKNTIDRLKSLLENVIIYEYLEITVYSQWKQRSCRIPDIERMLRNVATPVRGGSESDYWIHIYTHWPLRARVCVSDLQHCAILDPTKTI